MKYHPPNRQVNKRSGIALFVVMSALAILTIIVAELSYSTHMQSRLAYNHIDGLKAYYSAKAAYKIGLLRLSLYKQVREMLSKEGNSGIAKAVGASLIEKIWNFPFIYPIPLTEDASMIQKDAVKKFQETANLEGTFQVNITSMGAKLNINKLLVTTPDPSPTPSSSATPTPQPTPSASATTEVDFKPVAESMLNQQLNLRRETDREFAEQYRDVTGTDIIQAILIYMKPSQGQALRSNLPSTKDIIPKEAPLYSLSELHLVEGIDETLFDMIKSNFSAFNTPGININTASKETLWGLIPEFKEEDLVQILEMRDHPETGALFASIEDFWEAVGKTSVGSSVNTIKERLTKAGLTVTTSEKTFHLVAEAQVGLARRTIDAYLSLNESRQNQPSAQAQPGQSAQPGQTQQNQTNNPQNPQQNPSAQNASALNLLYWHLR